MCARRARSQQHARERPRRRSISKGELVTWFLGSHEYLLQCIEARATQVTVRYSLDEMFDIRCTLWGDTVLPAVKERKAECLGITGDPSRTG